jgi:hypothetical protein
VNVLKRLKNGDDVKLYENLGYGIVLEWEIKKQDDKWVLTKNISEYPNVNSEVRLLTWRGLLVTLLLSQGRLRDVFRVYSMPKHQGGA